LTLNDAQWMYYTMIVWFTSGEASGYYQISDTRETY